MVQSPNSRPNKRLRSLPLAVGGLAIVGVGVLASFFLFRSPNSQFSNGLQYLENQEKTDITQLETDLSKQQRERMFEAVNSGQYPISSLFRNAVVFGDSRVEALAGYGFLPASRVLAEIGVNIRSIPNHLEQVKTMQPQEIYFSFGVNDIDSNVGGAVGENGYGSVYEGLIDQVLAVSPNSKIIVCSILPVTQACINDNPQYERIPEYNQQIKEMCERRGWTYIDSTAFVESMGPDIYERDGIHFVASFYPEWLWSLLSAQS